MRLDINSKYCITSDPDQMIVSEKKVTQSGDNKGKERLETLGYFSTLNQCYKFLLHRQIRESDATDFKGILAEIERIERDINLSVRV